MIAAAASAAASVAAMVVVAEHPPRMAHSGQGWLAQRPVHGGGRHRVGWREGEGGEGVGQGGAMLLIVIGTQVDVKLEISVMVVVRPIRLILTAPLTSTHTVALTHCLSLTLVQTSNGPTKPLILPLFNILIIFPLSRTRIVPITLTPTHTPALAPTLHRSIRVRPCQRAHGRSEQTRLRPGQRVVRVTRTLASILLTRTLLP